MSNSKWDNTTKAGGLAMAGFGLICWALVRLAGWPWACLLVGAWLMAMAFSMLRRGGGNDE